MEKNLPFRKISGVSWETASPEAKKGLPAPPLPQDFTDAAAYEEARHSWVHRVLRVVALRQSALERAP